MTSYYNVLQVATGLLVLHTDQNMYFCHHRLIIKLSS
jgi:hypothetical protein